MDIVLIIAKRPRWTEPLLKVSVGCLESHCNIQWWFAAVINWLYIDYSICWYINYQSTQYPSKYFCPLVWRFVRSLLKSLKPSTGFYLKLVFDSSCILSLGAIVNTCKMLSWSSVSLSLSTATSWSSRATSTSHQTMWWVVEPPPPEPPASSALSVPTCLHSRAPPHSTHEGHDLLKETPM